MPLTVPLSTGSRIARAPLNSVGKPDVYYGAWIRTGPLQLSAIIEPAALDLLAERLSTPLQFTEYLSRALDVGFRTGQKPITPELVSATLAPDFDDLEPRLTRQGYSVKVLSDQFQSKPVEIKRFLSGQLEPARTRELAERMRMAGLSL